MDFIGGSGCSTHGSLARLKCRSLPGSDLYVGCQLMCVSCVLQSQLGISEVELKDLISGKERKVEEIQSALREIQVSPQSVAERISLQVLDRNLTARKKGFSTDLSLCLTC